MRFLTRFFGSERRSQTAATSDPYLADVLGGMRAGGGLAVSPDAVLSNLAVATRCVGLRSELLAGVGLSLYRRTDDGGRRRADDNPLHGVLHDLANPGMTAFEAREFLIRSLDMNGNAYARIERSGRGEVTAIYPLMPMAVVVERLPGGRLRYRVSDPVRGSMVLLQDEMLHVRGASRDGMLGQSPLQIARGALSHAVSQTEVMDGLMENSLRPSGILSFQDKVTVEQKTQIRDQVEKGFTGGRNAGRFMIMDNGAKFERITMTPEDAQFLATRKLSNEDVARIFGVPPTCVGITDKATYSNTEQEARALVQNSLGPLARRIEAAMMRCLLTDTNRRTLYVEHDLDSLLRGDLDARYKSYRLGREIGALCPNDIRRKENEPPIPNGDIYHQPANWVPLGTMPSPAEIAASTSTARDTTEQDAPR